MSIKRTVPVDYVDQQCQYQLTMAEFGGLLILQGKATVLPWWARVFVLLFVKNVTLSYNKKIKLLFQAQDNFFYRQKNTNEKVTKSKDTQSESKAIFLILYFPLYTSLLGKVSN